MIGHFRNEIRRFLVGVDQLQTRDMAIHAAIEPPGAETMSVALDGEAAVDEHLEFPDCSDAAAPPASGHGVLPQLVALHSQRQVRLDVLDGVVPCVRVKRVDGVHPIRSMPAAIAPFKNLHVHPMAAVIEAGKRDHAEIADAGRDLPRHCLSQRLHHRVRERVAGTETGDDRGWEDRVDHRSPWRDDPDRTGQP